MEKHIKEPSRKGGEEKFTKFFFSNGIHGLFTFSILFTVHDTLISDNGRQLPKPCRQEPAYDFVSNVLIFFVGFGTQNKQTTLLSMYSKYSERSFQSER